MQNRRLNSLISRLLVVAVLFGALMGGPLTIVLLTKGSQTSVLGATERQQTTW